MTARIWTSVVAMAAMVPLVSPGRCPQGSSQDGDYCVTFHALKHDWDLPKAKLSPDYSSNTCADLTLGTLVWRLPKPDSVAKNEFIGQYFLQQKVKKGTSVWLGLRRYEKSQTNDPSVWANPEKWFWTVDNTSISLMDKQNIDLWENNHPKVGEQCAVMVANSEAFFQWRSAHCAYRSNDSNQPDIGGIICEAKLDKEIPIYEQPWFYAVCISLIALSVLILLAAGIVYCRYRKWSLYRKRQKKNSDRSFIHRKNVPRKTPLPKKKKPWTWYNYKRDDSAVPKDTSPPSPVAAKAKTGPNLDDDDDVAYSNLQILKDDGTGSAMVSKVTASATNKSGAKKSAMAKSVLLAGKTSPGGSTGRASPNATSLVAASLNTTRSPAATASKKKTQRKM